MNIGKWFNNLSFFVKMLLVYTLFAVLPMVLVTGYNYTKTKQILQDKSYQEMRQNLETVDKNLESAFQAYGTVMDMLYTNQMLNSYLRIDYTELSYWDMFSYIDKQLRGLSVINTNISRVSFYSTNRTLPHDNFYFYQKEELPEGFMEKADEKAGSVVAGGIMERGGRKYLGLIRKLNYYSSGEIENYLLM